MEALRKAPPELPEQQLGKVVKTVFQAAKKFGTAVFMLPVSCGYVANPEIRGRLLKVHDHGKTRLVEAIRDKEYDPQKHGPLIDWLDEGERLSSINLDSTDGKAPIHRHKGRNLSGAHEYNYE